MAGLDWTCQTSNMVDKNCFRRFGIRSPFVRDFLSEFISTFVLVLCINGLIAQSVLTDGEKGKGLALNFAAGIGVMAGILIGGGVAGGHMNPALSLGFACVGKLSWRRLPAYWIGQYLGAFAGAACVFAVYIEAIAKRTEGHFEMSDTDPKLAAIFATYPAPFLSIRGAIIDQLVGTALLVGCSSAIIDSKNCKVPLPLIAFYVGLIITGLGVSFTGNCGGPINPARDLSPRLLSYLVGWGTNVFSFNNWYWFWIPLIIPHFGGIIGAFIYVIFIEAHWPE